MSSRDRHSAEAFRPEPVPHRREALLEVEAEPAREGGEERRAARRGDVDEEPDRRRPEREAHRLLGGAPAALAPERDRERDERPEDAERAGGAGEEVQQRDRPLGLADRPLGGALGERGLLGVPDRLEEDAADRVARPLGPPPVDVEGEELAPEAL